MTGNTDLEVTEQINRYQELVDAIKPILDEMGHLKKLMDDKTFKTLTKRLDKYHKKS